MALTVGELVAFMRLDDKDFVEKHKQRKADLDELAGQWDKAGSRADAAGLAFARAALNLAKIPATIGAIQGVTAALAPTVGALGVIPGALAAVVTAVAAVKIGAKGFGDAVAKGGEDLAKLPPNARAAAVAVRDLKTLWEGMQRSVQDALFKDLAGHIKTLGGTYIPVLKTGLSGVASELNRGTRETAAWLAKSAQVKDVQAIFKNSKVAVGELSSAMRPIVQILLDILAVSSEMLPNLTGGFGDAAQRAADFVRNARETGQLREWISGGLSALGDLWQLLKNIAGIIGIVFRSFDAEGAGTIQILIDLTDKVKEFLKSAEGQETLKALATALSTVAKVVTSVLIAALKQLAPIIINAAPGFAALAEQVGKVLVRAIEIAGPLLAGLAQFLSDNVEWLGPLTIALYGAVKAFEAVTAVMRILNIVSAVNPWLVIIAATIALVTLIITHWDQIKTALAAAWQWISDRASEIWGWIKRNIVDNITAAASWVGDRIQDILTFFGWLASLPGKALEWFGGILRAAVDKLGEVVAWFRDLPGKILGAIGDFGRLLWDAGRRLIEGLWEGIKSMISWLYNKISGFVGDMTNYFYHLLGIRSPSKVFRAIGVNVGKGLALGIDEMAPTVADSAGRLANAAMVDIPSPRTELTALGGNGSSMGGGFGGASGGGGSTVVIQTDGTRASAAMMQWLRESIRDQGGNVQVVLGQG